MLEFPSRAGVSKPFYILWCEEMDMYPSRGWAEESSDSFSRSFFLKQQQTFYSWNGFYLSFLTAASSQLNCGRK